MIKEYYKGREKFQAVQWEGDIESEELIQEFSGKKITFTDHPDFIIVLIELGKHLLLDLGDYLVRGSSGELNVVKGEDFELNYNEL